MAYVERMAADQSHAHGVAAAHTVLGEGGLFLGGQVALGVDEHVAQAVFSHFEFGAGMIRCLEESSRVESGDRDRAGQVISCLITCMSSYCSNTAED